MAERLVSDLEKVHLSNAALQKKDDDWIDHILDSQHPRKRAKQDPEELKRELEQKFLTPSTRFSTEWLNKLQQ
jgi:antiviral helicase SKI2